MSDEKVTVAYEVTGVTVCGEVLKHADYGHVYACLYQLPEGTNGKPFTSVPFRSTYEAAHWLEIAVKRHDGGYYDLYDWKDQVDWSMEHEGWRDEVYAPYTSDEVAMLGYGAQSEADEEEAEEIEIPSDIHGGHVGFWADVDGQPIHILGDPNMSEETLNALKEMARAVLKQQAQKDAPPNDEGEA